MRAELVVNKALEDPASYGVVDPGIDLRTRIITGLDNILALRPLLMALSTSCGQQGSMDHLEYFLTSAGSLKKTVYLVLLGENMHRPGVPLENAVAALLLFEYKVMGIGVGVFATDDTAGRRTLIAPKCLRARALDLACTAVMRAGGLIIVMSVKEEPESAAAAAFSPIRVNGAWRSTSREREIPSYLQMESTFEATLATMGSSTRRNLRRYRIKAEQDLGCSFVCEVEISRAEFRTFDQESSFPVGEAQADWRYDAAHGKETFLCGIRDRDGRWLSLVGGRRYKDVVELDWQMNRDSLPGYSLSTVMRSYFIEYAIETRAQRIFFEGGTPHAMRFSFATDLVRDVCLVKRSRRAYLMNWLALRVLPNKNFVREVLEDKTLRWSTVS